MAKSALQLLTSEKRTQRVPRFPMHTFNIRHSPYEITPFFLAPVIPGETMKKLMFQARVVSDPIKNPLIGWWYETYWFYVKHRDLDARDDLTAMMLDLDKDMSAYETNAVDEVYYAANGAINWAQLCTKRCVEEYFRNEGEAWDIATGPNGLPLASTNLDRSVFHSLIADDDRAPAEDIDVDLNADATVTAGEVTEAMRMYQFLVAHELTDMSYEDYLASHGVRTPSVEVHIPELVRYTRDWTYPTNTIDPSDGSPSSALSWSLRERADKDRYFSEPGFLIGLAVCRPKVYFRNQTGSVAGWMKDALSWLPAIMNDDPASSMQKHANTSGPLPTFADADGYWIDIKDLLIHGDQFVNFDDGTGADWSGVVDRNLLNLPATDGSVRYAPTDYSNELFVAGANAGRIRADGIVNLAILGAQVDTSPQF